VQIAGGTGGKTGASAHRGLILASKESELQRLLTTTNGGS
jgi:hypothetical protein